MLDEQMDIAVREGLIDPFDASEVPNIKSLYAISTPTKWQKDGRYFSAHQNWGQLGLTYRTDKVKDPAQGVARRVEARVQGVVGMPPVSYSVGLQFFIRPPCTPWAATERNPADVDRGFEKMKELKASIVQQPADAGRFSSFSSAATSPWLPLWDGRAHGLAAAGLPVGFSYPSKPGPVASRGGMGIAKVHQEPGAALKLIRLPVLRRRRKAFCQQIGMRRRTAR